MNFNDDIAKLIDDWTPETHGKAYKEASSAQREAINEATLSKLSLPEGIVPANKRSTPDAYDRPIALAAATNSVYGHAWGIAVGVENSQQGRLIKVNAAIDTTLVDHGSISISFPQVKYESNGDIYDGPRDLLENDLKILLSSVPVCVRLNLQYRRINVKVETGDSGYLKNAKSLTLAVLVAIVNAFQKDTCLDSLAFSADVDMTGGLTGVGAINDKIDICLQHPQIKQVCISEEDFIVVSEKLKNRFGDKLKPISNVNELFPDSGYDRDGKGVSTYKAGDYVLGETDGKIRFSLWLISFPILLFFTMAMFVFKSPFFIHDIIIALSLLNEQNNIYLYLTIANLFVLTVISIFLINRLTATIKNRKGPVRDDCSKGLMRSIMGNPLLSLSILIFIFLAANTIGLWHGRYTHASVSQTISRVVYLKSVEFKHVRPLNEYVRFLSQRIDNAIFLEFMNLSGKSLSLSGSQAISLGLMVEPGSKYFPLIFNDIAAILINRSKDGELALAAMNQYMRFANQIGHKENAGEVINDTIHAAVSLSENYSLFDSFVDGKRIGARLVELKLQYGIE